jgi:hypothetical protein
MKKATIVVNKSIGYLNAISDTNILSIDSAPFIKVDWQSLPIEEKCALIKLVVRESKTGLPFPTDVDGFNNFILEQFGVKSWSKMNKGGKRCQLRYSEEKDLYEFVPTVYRRGSHDGIKEGIERVSGSVSEKEFIEVFERALAKCE